MHYHKTIFSWKITPNWREIKCKQHQYSFLTWLIRFLIWTWLTWRHKHELYLMYFCFSLHFTFPTFVCRFVYKPDMIHLSNCRFFVIYFLFFFFLHLIIVYHLNYLLIVSLFTQNIFTCFSLIKTNYYVNLILIHVLTLWHEEPRNFIISAIPMRAHHHCPRIKKKPQSNACASPRVGNIQSVFMADR